MEFILITPHKLKVSLSAQDMRELGLDYDALDYTDPASRRLLVSILERGREQTGFHPRKAKLFIQVLPEDSGGCVVLFTCLRDAEGPASDTTVPGAVIFAFDDVDTMLDAAVKVQRRCGHRIYKSSLYRLDAGYRLIIYPLDYADMRSVSFLSEFAEKTGEGPVMAAFVEEHGALLAGDDALEVLARHFG